jgi:cytochrome c oxidase assembly protein subunit 15
MISPVTSPVSSTPNAEKSSVGLKNWQRRTLIANLIAQTGIVLTGAVVRLTASGLGCPTWPECVAGSIAPTSAQTESWHKYVEFGNRLLTFVLLIVALVTIVAIWQHNRSRREAGLRKRKSLTFLAGGSLVGIFGQAILGGITVLTGLHPLTFAAHFMVSIGLITVAQVLLTKAQEPDDLPIVRQVPKPLAIGMQVHVWLALGTVAIGTLVTGSGPHAGDTAEIVRLGFDERTISAVHADFVFLFVGLTVGLLVALAACNAPAKVMRLAWLVLAICIVQGIIGYTQYFTGLPWALVAVHVLGACLLWIACVRFYMSRNLRGVS